MSTHWHHIAQCVAGRVLDLDSILNTDFQYNWISLVLRESYSGSVKDLIPLKELGLYGPLTGCGLCHDMDDNQQLDPNASNLACRNGYIWPSAVR